MRCAKTCRGSDAMCKSRESRRWMRRPGCWKPCSRKAVCRYSCKHWSWVERCCLRRLLPDCMQQAWRVFNFYGPTEACIDATAHEISAADGTALRVPIGVPLGNYRVYVLDEFM